MGKTYTKKEAVSIAISASRLYKKNLVGKRLLFVMTDRHKNVFSLEVGFDASNFQHLTGLKLTNSKLSHKEFYNLCVDGRLSERDIIFADNGTTNQKLNVLPHVFQNANLSASMMGNYNRSHPLLYTEKLIGGVKWALGFRDVTGNGAYVPDTLLEGDIRDQVYDTYRIVATYIKFQHDMLFEQLIYKAKKIEYDALRYPDDWGSRPRLREDQQK